MAVEKAITPLFTNPPILETMRSLGADAALTDSWSPLIDELRRFHNLKNDWDGEGTEAPPPALIEAAIRLAHAFQKDGAAPADRVIVGVNGTIYFEWHTPLRYREIEVISPVAAESRWVRKGSDVSEVSKLSLPS